MELGDDVSEILNVRRYRKYGYQLVYFMTTGHGLSKKPFKMCTALTWPEGLYIGDKKTAYLLCVKKGIKPEKIPKKPLPKLDKAKRLLENIDGNITPCSIGFCDKDQKWYGWSHRAIYGFGIGNRVKKGDAGYIPFSPEDMLEDMIRFDSDDNHIILGHSLRAEDPNHQIEGFGVLVKEEIKSKNGKSVIYDDWEPYPVPWGKGEWEAKTLEDAKQMAINFAQGIA